LNGNPNPPNAPNPPRPIPPRPIPPRPIPPRPIPAVEAETDETEEMPAAVPTLVPIPAPTPAPIAADAGMLNAMTATISIDSTANFLIVLIQSPLLDIVKVEETIINILLFIITKSNRFIIYYNSKVTK
jgi:hypothetical protein